MIELAKSANQLSVSRSQNSFQVEAVDVETTWYFVSANQVEAAYTEV